MGTVTGGNRNPCGTQYMKNVGLVLRNVLPAARKAAAVAIILLAACVLVETATHRAVAGDIAAQVPVANEPAAVPPSADWPQWCGRQDRNMVSGATGLPDCFDQVRGSNPDAGGLRNVKWVARLGEATYGSPVVAGGRVYLGGCQSGMGRDDAIGMLWCFRQSDGALLWRLRSPYIAQLYNRSFGITSTPTVEGDRVYLLGHLGEVLCLNANGLAMGNTGPFKDEESLLAVGRERLKAELAPDGNRIMEFSGGTPGKLGPTDADIVWRFDMIKLVRVLAVQRSERGAVDPRRPPLRADLHGIRSSAGRRPPHCSSRGMEEKVSSQNLRFAEPHRAR